MSHDSFITTTRGLRRESLPMRLFEKAKRLGVWNPSDIDLTKDRLDWQKLDSQEKTVLLHLTSLFQSGEEAVTLDLLPLIQVIAQEGRLEEEIFLTSFLFEEAKHTDFFRRFLDEVIENKGNLSSFASENYRTIVYETLPKNLLALRTDASPEAQIRASVTYNLIVEGVLAETGYQAYFSILQKNNLMPGMQRGIGLLKQDESRHIAYGIFLLSRLIVENPQLWSVMEEEMNALLYPAIGVVGDIFSSYDPMPFGLVIDDFTDFAMDQFTKRFTRIEKAREMSITRLYQEERLLFEEE